MGVMLKYPFKVGTFTCKSTESERTIFILYVLPLTEFSARRLRIVLPPIIGKLIFSDEQQ